MKPVLIVALCLVALCYALPVDEEHERDKRSSSGERGYGMPFYYPSYANGNSNSNLLNLLLPFLIARLLPAAAAPAPAPAPAPAGK